MAKQVQQYNNPPASNDPREIEGWALMKSAARLDKARLNLEDDEEVRESLRINQLLWTIFQDSVARPDTELPPEVRDNILRLSIFVDKRTYQCLGDLDRNKLQLLIDLNRNIALGLMGMPGDGIDPAKTEPTADNTNTEIVKDV
jgi:flagellar biosynthesis activator protein FlaF